MEHHEQLHVKHDLSILHEACSRKIAESYLGLLIKQIPFNWKMNKLDLGQIACKK